MYHSGALAQFADSSLTCQLIGLHISPAHLRPLLLRDHRIQAANRQQLLTTQASLLNLSITLSRTLLIEINMSKSTGNC